MLVRLLAILWAGPGRWCSPAPPQAAAHVPYCEPPAPDPVTGAIPPDAPCIKDQVHGLPPAEIRQPGDMGNLETAVPRTSTVRTPRATTPHCCVRVTSHALSLVGAPRIHRR